MSYVVLARKYRPQSFEDVVGQNPVSQTLLNALTQGRVAHAYVFSGPRGVGKTTTARILAKCLNCVKGPTRTPCNACDSCQSISTGTSLDDVLEIDGASNRGIEQIRELRESAKYAPARSRYRIFIIDEAHQITKDAFGALLKTLEEPPSHVVFMMATTEVQKIPPPILSRCQRFTLRPISTDLVFSHLKEICKKEKVQIDDEALVHIVRFVEGSLRDALSLLDQALVFSPEGITSQTIRDLLGLLPKDLIRNFAATLLEGDPAAILKQAGAAVQDGVDLTQLGKDLQNYYHTLLLAKAGVEDAFKLEVEETRKEASRFDYSTLERNIRLLARALDDMRHSETPRAVFEAHALKLGQKTLDPRALIERLEKLSSMESGKALGFQTLQSQKPGTGLGSAQLGGSPRQSQFPASDSNAAALGSATSGAPAPQSFSEGGTPRVERSQGVHQTPGQKFEPSQRVVQTAPVVETFERHEGPTQTAAPAVQVTGEALESGWAELIEEVSKSKGMLGSALEEAIATFSDGRVTLTFKKTFSQDLVNRSLDALRPFFEARFSGPVSIDMRLDAAGSNGGSAGPAGRPAGPGVSTSVSRKAFEPPVEDSEVFEEVGPADVTADLQKALKHFPGVVKREKKS